MGRMNMDEAWLHFTDKVLSASQMQKTLKHCS